MAEINTRLRDAIDNFCMREYGCMGDFENPERVAFLYTTVCGDELEEDGDPADEVELQIYIDAPHNCAIYQFGSGAIPGLVEEYNDPEELAEEIIHSDFDSWYSAALDAWHYSSYYKKDWELEAIV